MKKHIFGPAVAFVESTEWQKRGLPHMHLLVWLNSAAKIENPDETDQIISAEFVDIRKMPEGPEKEMGKEINTAVYN